MGAAWVSNAQTFYNAETKNLEFARFIELNHEQTQARSNTYQAQHDLALAYLMVQDAEKSLKAFELLQASFPDQFNDEDRFYCALAQLRNGNSNAAELLIQKAKSNGYKPAQNSFYSNEIKESHWNIESFQTLLDPKAYGAYGLILAQDEEQELVALYSANADVLLDRKKSTVFDRPYYALFDSKLGVLQSDYASSKQQLYIQDAHRLNPELATYLHHQPSQYWPGQDALLFTQNAEKFNQNNERLFEVYRSDWDGSKWVATPLNINDPSISVSSMVISPNGKLAAFASNGFGSVGQSDVFLADVISCEKGKFEVTNVRSLGAQINTSLRENFPFFLSDDVLVFSSEGHYGKGGLDLFQYHLQTGEFMRLPGRFNSAYDDFGFSRAAGWISVSSNRLAGTYMDDIYAIQATSGPRSGFDDFAELPPVKQDFALEEPVVQQPVEVPAKQEPATPQVRVTSELDGQKISAFKATFIDEEETATSPANGQVAVGSASTGSSPTSAQTSETQATGSQAMDASTVQPDRLGSSSGLVEAAAVADPLRKIKMERRGYYSKVIQVRQSVLDTGIVEAQLRPMAKGDLLGEDMGIGPVYYELDRTELDANDKSSLDQLAAWMKQYPYVIVELRSHTDARASDAYNQNLSMRRTRSALNYMLSAHNLTSARFKSTWVGESQLAVPCPDGVPCSEVQHALNRRTTFHIDRY